jgi:hypothetical protein
MKNEGGQANADAQAHHPNNASPKGFFFGVKRVIHGVLFTALAWWMLVTCKERFD